MAVLPKQKLIGFKNVFEPDSDPKKGPKRQKDSPEAVMTTLVCWIKGLYYRPNTDHFLQITDQIQTAFLKIWTKILMRHSRDRTAKNRITISNIVTQYLLVDIIMEYNPNYLIFSNLEVAKKSPWNSSGSCKSEISLAF